MSALRTPRVQRHDPLVVMVGMGRSWYPCGGRLLPVTSWASKEQGVHSEGGRGFPGELRLKS